MTSLGERSGLPCMVLILLYAILLSGYGIDALSYGYTATVESRKTQVNLRIVDKSNNNPIPNINVLLELARTYPPLEDVGAPGEVVTGTTDVNGVFEATLFYGEYRVVVFTVPTRFQSFEVIDSGEEIVTIEVKM